MTIQVKTFNDLTAVELYEILHLRSEVFVVEQDCVYQDIDFKDQKAFHIIGTNENTIVAYARVFAPGDYFINASIGRVVVHPEFRGRAYGQLIMKASMDYAFAKAWSPITISAQCYLDKFYTDLGFKSTGKKYLEDGIPHQEMVIENHQ